MLNSAENEICPTYKKMKYQQFKLFFPAKESRAWFFFLLIYIKMPTIVGILIFISRKNFMLNWVEYEKKFYDVEARSAHTSTAFPVCKNLLRTLGLPYREAKCFLLYWTCTGSSVSLVRYWPQTMLLATWFTWDIFCIYQKLIIYISAVWCQYVSLECKGSILRLVSILFSFCGVSLDF